MSSKAWTFALVAGLILSAAPIDVLVNEAIKSYDSTLLEFRPWHSSLSMLDDVQHTGIQNLRNVKIRTDNALLAGWYAPSTNGASIIVMHGTNADRSSMLPELRILSSAGFGVLAFDWPGNGMSSGEIHWGRNEQVALHSAIDWLLSQANIPTKIGALGFSLGGVIVAQVAAQDSRLAAVALEATPTAMNEYVLDTRGKWGPLSRLAACMALSKAGWDSSLSSPVAVLPRVAPRPLWIVGGTQDPVVHAALVRKLYAAAIEPKSLWMVETTEHGGYAHTYPQEYAQHLVGFFSQALLSSTAPSSH